MEQAKIDKVKWVLAEIGAECEQEMSHKSDEELLFKLRSATTDLSDCLKMKSDIEARTEYFVSVMRLAQTGYRFNLLSEPPENINYDKAIVEALKDVAEHLYSVASELTGQKNVATVELTAGLNKLDSVILEMEMSNE